MGCLFPEKCPLSDFLTASKSFYYNDLYFLLNAFLSAAYDGNEAADRPPSSSFSASRNMADRWRAYRRRQRCMGRFVVPVHRCHHGQRQLVVFVASDERASYPICEN